MRSETEWAEAGQDRQASPWESAAQAMAARCEELDQQLQRLTAKVEPLLRPAEPSEAPGLSTTRDPSQSHVVTVMYDRAEDLDRYIARVRNLYDRLDT